LKLKLFVCVALTAVMAAACKGPATNTSAAPATAATPAGSAQPGTAGLAAAGHPAAPGQPAAVAAAKPIPTQLPDVVARVNGEDVKKAELERAIKSMEGRAGQPVPPERRDEIYRGALDQLVVLTLLKQESKSKGVKVDDAEIDQQVQQLKGQFPTPAAFETALKERGMTLEGLKSEARSEIGVNKLMETAVANVPGPTDAEAKDFYEKNPDKFKQDEQIRASHILVRVAPNADAKTKAHAKAEIDDVLKQLKAGGDFAKLAQQHSQDGSAAQGGDLGFFPKGQMVPEFEKVAFSLPVGQLSGVVTTQFGYHILKVTEKKPPRTVPFEEAAAQIKQFLEQDKKQKAADAFIETLKKKARIEVLI
jgi:peptidyl-prolyl cis-trans isomerase C